MNEAAAGSPGAPKCQLRGMAIVGVPFARAHDEYCCEGCFLAARKRRSLAAESDDAPFFALAEALVVALDAREHETGLHSKRVACRNQS